MSDGGDAPEMLAPEPNTELGGGEAAAADCGPGKKGRVSRVYNGRSINNIVDRLNDLDSKWQAIRGPVVKGKSATLKAAKMDKCPGAAIQHVFLGLLVSIPANQDDCTPESLKNMVKIDL